MSIRGLVNIFKDSIRTLKGSGLKNGTKEILQGVYKEGGRTSSIFCGIGFTAGLIAPAAIVTAPLLGFTGAVTGKLVSMAARQGLKLAQKSISIFT